MANPYRIIFSGFVWLTSRLDSSAPAIEASATIMPKKPYIALVSVKYCVKINGASV